MTKERPRAFGDAIALSSPSGRMSKRSLRAAQERIRHNLFGDAIPKPCAVQPTQYETLMRQAQELRDLALRGMKPRAYAKKAAALELEAQLWLLRDSQ